MLINTNCLIIQLDKIINDLKNHYIYRILSKYEIVFFYIKKTTFHLKISWLKDK